MTIAIFHENKAQLYDVPHNCDIFKHTPKIVINNYVDTNVESFKFVLEYLTSGSVPTNADTFNKMYNLLVFLNIDLNIDEFNIDWKLHILSMSDNLMLKKNILMNMLNHNTNEFIESLEGF